MIVVGVSGAVVEACRPPVLKIGACDFTSDELSWFFVTLKAAAGNPDGFEQALCYISEDRAWLVEQRSA